MGTNSLPADPTVKLEPVRLPERDPRPLTEAQVEALLAAIPTAEKRNRLLFSLLYETGIRVGEALGILVPHIHLNEVDSGYIRVLGKGDRERIVPLIDAPRTVRQLREALKSLSSVGPLFRGDVRKGGSGGKPSIIRPSTTILSATLRSPDRRNRLCSSPSTKPLPSIVCGTPTQLKNCATAFLCPRSANLLGHKNIQTTLRYAETDLETIKQQLVEARKRRR